MKEIATDGFALVILGMFAATILVVFGYMIGRESRPAPPVVEPPKKKRFEGDEWKENTIYEDGVNLDDEDDER